MQQVYYALIEPYLEYCVSLKLPQIKRNIDNDKWEWVLRKANRMVQGMETMFYEDRLNELGIFSLEKRQLKGNTIAIYKYLRGCHVEDAADLFSVALQGRTKQSVNKGELN